MTTNITNLNETELEKIKKHKDLILLAEIGALIHDLGKLSEFFIKKHSIEGANDPILKGYSHGDVLEYDSDPNSNKDFYPNDKVLQNSAKKLKELLEKTKVSYQNSESHESNLYLFLKQHHLDRQQNSQFPNKIVELLSISDSFDAKEDRQGANDKQLIKTYKSTAFGYEKEINEVNFNAERKKIYDSAIDLIGTRDIYGIKDKRSEFLDVLKESFTKTLGMTARAANDVSLWEHSYMTVCIMKALICESILKDEFPVVKDKEEIPGKKPFKILSVGWDFFDFISQSHKIPDVTGRIKVLEKVKKEVKKLIETEFLLGNCIYEDDYGLHFLIPASFNDKETVKESIYKIFNEETDGILVPYFTLTGAGGSLVELLPKAKELLENKIKEKRTDFNKPRWIEKWNDINVNLLKKKLICNVCGKGFYCEGYVEEICKTCKKIRDEGRKEKPPQTVYIDEIAWNSKDYENVALVLLNFNLNEWLNGEYIKSLFMGKAIDEKKLSDGKIREIIMRRVGPKISKKECLSANELDSIKKDINAELNKQCILNGDVKRIVEDIINPIKDISADKIGENLNSMLTIISDKYIVLTKKQDTCKKNPSPSRIMRVWNNTTEFFEELEKCICEKAYALNRCIIGVNNLPQFGAQAWEAKIIAGDKNVSGEVIFKKDECITVTPHINDFIEKNKNINLEVEITDKEWTHHQKKFFGKFKEKRTIKGYRTISLSPNIFMFLIPSSNVVEIIKEAKKRYMAQFGRVYGKLPLNVGAVFFKRKTPFYACLDSARRFINCFEDERMREEISFSIKGDPDKKDDVVEINADEYALNIPYKLGNGTDYYHPFIRVNSNSDEKHVLCLNKSDNIIIDPSYFDFEFLDISAGRFKISINRDVKKREHPILGKEGTKPYYLEDFDNFTKLWEILNDKNKITSSQINNLSALLTSKIQEWNLEDKKLDSIPEFVNLVENSIVNIFRMDKKDDKFKFIKNAILSGLFFNVIEFYMKIIKEKIKGEQNG